MGGDSRQKEVKVLKAAFYTLGCKVNQYETEMMRERFLESGYEIVGPEDRADVYVVNTCTVTNLADRKSRQFIRRANKLNPGAVIAVTGCYVQVDEEAVKNIEGVDVILGTDSKHRILEAVEKCIEEKRSEGSRSEIVEVKPYDDLTEYEELGRAKGMGGRTRAFVKIEDGCDRFCSYCIIPYARGKVRSRAREAVRDEVKGLVDLGYKEIVLTGINTALYGYDTGDNGIEPLLKDLDVLEGDFRIRLSSLEPQVIDADYAAGLLKFDRLCHHLHLSAQSGSNEILRAMNRSYTRDDYIRIVERLRTEDPAYGISADIIVGFPGETDKDFDDSMRLVEDAGMCRTHVFKYSRRSGTKAAEMEDQIPDSVKTERSRELIKKADEIQKKFIESLKGAERRVLLERAEGGTATGYTDNYIKVFLPDYCGDPDGGRYINAVIGEPHDDGAFIREI